MGEGRREMEDRRQKTGDGWGMGDAGDRRMEAGECRWDTGDGIGRREMGLGDGRWETGNGMREQWGVTRVTPNLLNVRTYFVASPNESFLKNSPQHVSRDAVTP